MIRIGYVAYDFELRAARAYKQIANGSDSSPIIYPAENGVVFFVKHAAVGFFHIDNYVFNRSAVYFTRDGVTVRFIVFYIYGNIGHRRFVTKFACPRIVISRNGIGYRTRVIGRNFNVYEIQSTYTSAVNFTEYRVVLSEIKVTDRTSFSFNSTGKPYIARSSHSYIVSNAREIEIVCEIERLIFIGIIVFKRAHPVRRRFDCLCKYVYRYGSLYVFASNDDQRFAFFYGSYYSVLVNVDYALIEARKSKGFTIYFGFNAVFDFKIIGGDFLRFGFVKAYVVFFRIANYIVRFYFGCSDGNHAFRESRACRHFHRCSPRLFTDDFTALRNVKHGFVADRPLKSFA